MVVRIGFNNEAAQWAAQIAQVRLRTDNFKLAAALVNGAENQVIGENRAAAQVSHAKLGARLIDVIV